MSADPSTVSGFANQQFDGVVIRNNHTIAINSHTLQVESIGKVQGQTSYGTPKMASDVHKEERGATL
jgi:hypothetical protein